jgi:hypothetical protein
MAYHQYKCKKCECEFELEIGLIDGQYILRVPFTEEEEEEMWAKGIDPRFEETELTLKELPMSPPCMQCDSNETEKLMPEFNGWCKGNCFTNRERERKFYEKGMPKDQALNFYKESIQASKERIATGGVHYKEIVPDMDHMRKHGVAKKLNDKQVANKREYLKKANTKLAEIAKVLPKEPIK